MLPALGNCCEMIKFSTSPPAVLQFYTWTPFSLLFVFFSHIMSPTIAAIIGISFLATLVRSTFGFGEALIAVPLFSLFVPLHIAVPLSVMMSVLVAAVVVVQDRREIHSDSAKWLVLSALPGIPLGLLLLVYGNEYWVKIILGILIVIYSLYTILANNTPHLRQDNRFWLFTCGFLSGILGGAYGINGPPLVLYGHMQRWNAQHFRATLQAYFLPVSLIGLAGYFIQGLLDWQVIWYFLLCLPLMIPAIFLGRYVNRKLQGHSFFRYVYGGLLLVGLLLISFTIAQLKI